jgi:hypothetical protein
MSSFREHRRATVFLFALTFLTGSTKGICMMPAADSGKAGTHDCCKKGWQAALPSCCVEVGTDEATAKVTARVVAPAPAVATVPPVGVKPPSAPPVGQTVARTHSVHSPPPRTILRV